MAIYIEKQYQKSPLGAVVEDSMTSGSKVNAPSINAVQNAISNQNLFLNPDFSIWQRGETITVGTTRTYTADRWGVYFKSTVARNVDGAGMKITAVAGDYGSVNQYIEFSYESIGFLINKPLTLTVRLKTSRVMNANIGLVGNGKNITTATGWVGYTYTFIPKDTDFIYMDNGTYYLRVNIFGCESTNPYQDGDIIEISWAKLEQGSIATPFVSRPYAEELAMCQRYYRIGKVQGTRYVNSGGFQIIETFNIDEMRVAPTVKYTAFDSFAISSQSVGVTDSRTLHYSIVKDSTIGGYRYGMDWTADAEIY